MTAKPTPLGGPKPLVAGGALGIPLNSQDAATYQFTPGTYTFRPPRAGVWRFVGWSAGGGSDPAADSGASGAYFEVTKFVDPSMSIALAVGAGVNNATGGNTSVTFPDGRVALATGGGKGANPGVASGGDVNLNGSNGPLNASGTLSPVGLGTGGGSGGIANGGAGAPANLPFRGGDGATVSFGSGGSPGAGQGQVQGKGGGGMILAFFVRN